MLEFRTSRLTSTCRYLFCARAHPHKGHRKLSPSMSSMRWPSAVLSAPQAHSTAGLIKRR